MLPLCGCVGMYHVILLMYVCMYHDSTGTVMQCKVNNRLGEWQRLHIVSSVLFILGLHIDSLMNTISFTCPHNCSAVLLTRPFLFCLLQPFSSVVFVAVSA